MTDLQTMELATLAKDLLPRTTDAQAALLRKAVAPYEFNAVKEILQACALSDEEQRLNLPRVMERVTARSAVGALERHAAEAQRDAERQREERLARRQADEYFARAREFCAAHAGELEEWRTRICAEIPTWGRYAKRPVLESEVLCRLIYERFGATVGSGARPRIPGGTANPPHPAGQGDASHGREDVAARGRARAPRQPDKQPLSRSHR